MCLAAWDYLNPAYMDHLTRLNELRQRGEVQMLGLCNFDTVHLKIVVESGIPIATNQVSFSMLDTRAAGAMSDYCLSHGIKLLCFGTLLGGFLTDRWLGAAQPSKEDLQTWSLMKYMRYIEEWGGWELFQELLQTVKLVADRHNVKIANVATKWVLQQPAVAAVLVGCRLGHSEHRASNRRLVDGSFELQPEDMSRIQLILDKAKGLPGDSGDEYRYAPFLTATGDLSHHISALPNARKTSTRAKVWTRVIGTPTNCCYSQPSTRVRDNR